MSKSMFRLFISVIAAFSLVAAFALPAAGLAGEVRTAQPTFNDIADQPADIQQAIIYACQAGYMEGFPDGGFHPKDAATRLDCARALVSIFHVAGEPTDPNITFTDLPASDPGYRWANLAVKFWLIGRFQDGTFAPNQGMLFEWLTDGVAIGTGLGTVAQNINNLLGGTPAYGGAMTVFMDLHLKNRASRVWPGKAYPRGELAYALYRLDNMESWRPTYIKASFTPERCVLPNALQDQIKAAKFGFERLGCPYVYGGETEAEGGFDCSGFVYNTLSIRMGYVMNRVADDQARDTRYLFVSREALEPGDAIFFYDDPNGGPSSYIGHAGMYIGNDLFIHSTGSNAGVSIDCLDENDYWGSHLAWGRRVVGGPYNDRFDTYLLLYNPSQQELPVDVRYLLPTKGPQTKKYTLGPHSRQTVAVDNLYAYDEVSMEVSAPSPGVIAERAMYFNYQGWADGGHASTGVAQATLEGYLAEGYTGKGFNTWLLLSNPDSQPAEVEVSYLLEGADPIVCKYSLAPSSRFTVLVNGVPGLKAGSVGMRYRSLNGVKVVAERSMYFNYNGIRGGSCSQAVSETSTKLYLAEGYTGPGFDTWILLANPNQSPADVRVTYLLPDGQTATDSRTISAQSRLTINARDKVPGQSFGATIESLNGVGIVAERSMYFDYAGNIDDGHCSAAVANPSQTLYLAEGYTGGDFDTWILLANPNQEAASAKLTFSKEDGSEVKVDIVVPGLARYTVRANDVKGLENCSFATRMDSDRPLLMERSMYFFYRGWSGGTNCTALDGTSQYRFFAEGYTGG
jgi:NlpC/P60 family/S-layer homology domain